MFWIWFSIILIALGGFYQSLRFKNEQKI